MCTPEIPCEGIGFLVEAAIAVRSGDWINWSADGPNEAQIMAYRQLLHEKILELSDNCVSPGSKFSAIEKEDTNRLLDRLSADRLY